MQYVSSADSTGSGETDPAYSGSLQHCPGRPGKHPEQHTSKLLQQHHQLSQGKQGDDELGLRHLSLYKISSYHLYILLGLTF